MQARRLSVDLINLWNRLHHLIDMPHEKARCAMYHNLRSGPPSKRNYRTPESHRFNHHYAKGLLPLNWVKETPRSTQKAQFLLHVHRPNILDLFIIDLRFNLLMEVAHRFLLVAVYRSSQHYGHFRPFCRLDGQMRSFLTNEPSQPYEEIASFLAGRAELTHFYAVMHHSHEIERKLLLCTSAFTTSHHRDRRCPIHIIAVMTTSLAPWSSIKGKMAV